MDDKRETDRRKKQIEVSTDKRKGPRRLVCTCGGKVEIVEMDDNKENFICLRCGKKQ
jgi:hypothetical protein